MRIQQQGAGDRLWVIGPLVLSAVGLMISLVFVLPLKLGSHCPYDLPILTWTILILVPLLVTLAIAAAFLNARRNPARRVLYWTVFLAASSLAILFLPNVSFLTGWSSSC